MNVDVDLVLGEARELKGRGDAVVFNVLVQVHSVGKS